MLKLDTFSKIGSQHKICEDYCIMGTDPFPYLVLSDGCSSSLNTDMGSRIICHLTKQYLLYNQNYLNEITYETLGNWVIHNAQLVVKQLGLNEDCLDATLIVCYPYSTRGQNFFKIIIYGDGCIIFKRPNNFHSSISIEHKPNAPYYLSYKLNHGRNKLYHQMKVTKKILYDVSFEKNPPVYSERAYDLPFEFDLDLDKKEDYTCVFLCTDGLESFLNGATKVTKEELNNIKDEFFAFKTTNGEFLKRRIPRALKSLEAFGITHYDDLTIGAILLE